MCGFDKDFMRQNGKERKKEREMNATKSDHKSK